MSLQPGTIVPMRKRVITKSFALNFGSTNKTTSTINVPFKCHMIKANAPSAHTTFDIHDVGAVAPLTGIVNSADVDLWSIKCNFIDNSEELLGAPYIKFITGPVSLDTSPRFYYFSDPFPIPLELEFTQVCNEFDYKSAPDDVTSTYIDSARNKVLINLEFHEY